MDFSLPDDLRDLQERTREFIRDQVIPLEGDPRETPHGPNEELRDELIARGRAAGLLSPHCGTEWGGLGLGHIGKAVVFEEAGYSALGPHALNINAPDEGNMHLLEQVAGEEQKERFLRPLVAGEVRSAFSMTEPEGGAGSDPSMLKTEARETADGYLINGRKWLVTGVDGAAFQIVMARTFDAAGNDLGATMFLADMQVPGCSNTRVLDTMDTNLAGGHSVVDYKDVVVPKDSVLGEVGKGFRYAQVRLAPARLTHCMRWLGSARRCHDIAVDYARERHAFGKPIGEHEGVGFQLADNLQELHLSRLSIWHCAWVLDQGEHGSTESSMAKVFCSEATGRIVDRCVQVLGGTGITADTQVMRMYKDIRAFRIYDGPSEVHRWALARKLLRANR
ncbi:MAG: acyl-CoA dehydrogenase family protein [Alphaproteobacteria bacterium]|nr:acyl-CoA dehydrogenase family protein [Alphaproteobacteria bacterium]MDP6813884.1 acyl-CoA dehydrogenase family protein [Alphaproteobacteria bacterium]